MSKIKESLLADMSEASGTCFENPKLSPRERVSKWNAACGKEPLEKGTEEYWKALKNQLDRISEELNETIDKGLVKRDLLELLDGGCDLEVTVAGFNELLNMQYSEAIDAVLTNNDKKIHSDSKEALKTLRHYEDQGIHCYIYQGSLGFVVKRVYDDKIMKPYNHPVVDLTKYI